MTDPWRANQIATGLPGYVRHDRVGSSLYVPDPGDIDLLVQVGSIEDAARSLGEWEIESGMYEISEIRKFLSVRRGSINLLLTADEEFFDGFVKAAQVCKLLNLPDREMRCRVHRIVRDGWTADQAAGWQLPETLLGIDSK